MSDFREYAIEIAAASHAWRAGLKAGVLEVVRAQGGFRCVPGGRLAQAAQAGCTWSAAALACVQQGGVAAGVFGGQTRSLARLVQQARAGGVFGAVQGVRMVQRARPRAVFRPGRAAWVAQRARAQDAIAIGIGWAAQERTDAPGFFEAAMVAQVAQAGAARDGWIASLAARAHWRGAARAGGRFRAAVARVAWVLEGARASEQVWARYAAQARLHEPAYALDAWMLPGGQGFAWTAPVQGWAMSRYDRYPFDSLAEADGVMYASGQGGVWALCGGDEVIQARLLTARMDVGRGGRAHPLYAYLEYELLGAASMTVTQLQDGVEPRSWTYELAREPANCLTNGRFVFGRGLRGRHFVFDLRLQGGRAHVDDLYVVSQAARRRV